MVVEHGCKHPTKGGFAQIKRSLTADETLGTELAEEWDSQWSKWKERPSSRAEEVLTNHEFIKLLNDDNTVELFKATVARRVIDELFRSSRMLGNSIPNLKQTSVDLSDKSGDVPMVILMIEEVVTLLKAEQGENDGKKACCIKSFGHTEHEVKILAHQICDHREAIADYSDQLSNLHERIVEGFNDVHSEEGKGWCCGAHVTGQGAHCWSETCAFERIEEQTDVPVLGVGEQIVDLPVPRIQKEIGEVIQLIAQDSKTDHIVEKPSKS